MKGYIIKDMYISKKMLYIAFWGYIFILIFGLVFRFAYDYGNLKDLKDTVDGSPSCEIACVALSGIFLAIVLCMNTILTIDKDREAGFVKYLFSTSLDKKTMSAAKILELLLFTGIAIALMGLYSVIFGALFGFTNVKYGLLIGLIGILLFSFVVEISIPLSYIMKSSDVAISSVVFFLMAIYMGIVAYGIAHPNSITKKISYFLMGEVDTGIDKLVLKYSVVIIFILIILDVIGALIAYFCTVKAMERREKLCGV